jgi:hypothetical protein
MFKSKINLRCFKRVPNLFNNLYFVPKILYIPVPQSEHLPFNAKRLFFIVTFCSSFIVLLLLHFTQYPFSAISTPPLNEHIIYGTIVNVNYKCEFIPQLRKIF